MQYNLFSCIFVVYLTFLGYNIYSPHDGNFSGMVIRLYISSIFLYYIYILDSIGYYYINNKLASIIGEQNKKLFDHWRVYMMCHRGRNRRKKVTKYPLFVRSVDIITRQKEVGVKK